MLTPDFQGRAFTAEVLVYRRGRRDVITPISRLTQRPLATVAENKDDEARIAPIKLFHSYIATKYRYHGANRSVVERNQQVAIPREKKIRGVQHYLYDILVAESDNLVVIAVPFHGLGMEIFPRIDRALAGTGAVYETLDVTKLVLQLGASGIANVANELDIGLTRCQLVYSDRGGNRLPNLRQVAMSGANLGSTHVYRDLIAPVLKPQGSDFIVTPILLGFAVFESGVKKASAITDKHGNFKVWVSPGLRQVLRFFKLLKAIESIDGVVGVTSSLPIFQSRDGRDQEEAES